MEGKTFVTVAFSRFADALDFVAEVRRGDHDCEFESIDARVHRRVESQAESTEEKHRFMAHEGYEYMTTSQQGWELRYGWEPNDIIEYRDGRRTNYELGDDGLLLAYWRRKKRP